MNELFTQFDSVFIEKSRLSIMTILYRRKTVTFLELKALLATTDGALYSHMQKLLQAGYVERRKRIAGDRAQTIYTLSKTGAALFRRYLSFLATLLESSEIINAQEDHDE